MTEHDQRSDLDGLDQKRQNAVCEHGVEILESVHSHDTPDGQHDGEYLGDDVVERDG